MKSQNQAQLGIIQLFFFFFIAPFVNASSVSDIPADFQPSTINTSDSTISIEPPLLLLILLKLL